jgi:hypothetical protein
MGRRPSVLDQVNLLNLAPVRIADWKEIERRVVVERPRPRSGGLRGLGYRVAYVLSARRLRLDEIGSFAWRHLDGVATVGEIARQMREELGERVEPAEERLGLFIRQLRREGLVAYPDEDQARTRI